MPRARSPARDKAYQMWLEADGVIKLKDIAASIGVPESRVRKWKSEDKWEKERSETDEKERSFSASRKRGGQPGNKNAAGKHTSDKPLGGPPGNQYALKHGAFTSALNNMLSEEERNVMKETEMDSAEEELCSLYAMLNLKEVRLMKRIQDLRDREAEDDMITKTITANKTEEEYGIFLDRIGEKEKEDLSIEDAKPEHGSSADAEDSDSSDENKKPEHKLVSIGRFADDKQAKSQQVSRTLILDYILKLESELDKVHARKMKVVKQIEDIKLNRERFELQKSLSGNGSEKGDTAKAWAAAVIAASGGRESQDGPGGSE